MAKYHKITGNESLGSIAAMYGTDPQTLSKANPGMLQAVAGANLRIPSLTKVQPMPSLSAIGGGVGGGGKIGIASGGVSIDPYQQPLPGYNRVNAAAGSGTTPNVVAQNVVSQNAVVPQSGATAYWHNRRATGGTAGGTATAAVATPYGAEPTGMYTGGNSENDIAWRKKWDWQAQNPGLVPKPPVYVPTKSDVWNMKAEQRRKRNNSGGSSGGSSSVNQPSSIGAADSIWRIG